MKLIIPSVRQVIEVNKHVCEAKGNTSGLLDQGKIESAINTAFYPGSYPFQNGGVARIAAALCFYLVMAHAFVDGNKRTGALVAITFMNLNAWSLSFPEDEGNGKTALANLIERCAASKASKVELMDWFELHKVKLVSDK